MADDAAREPAEPPTPGAPGRSALRAWYQRNRSAALVMGCVGLLVIIAADVYVMIKADAKRRSPGEPKVAAIANPAGSDRAAETAPGEGAAGAHPEAEASAGANAGAGAGATAMDGQDFYESDDGEPRPSAGEKPSSPGKRFATVQQAAVDSCTTASVDGLSRQIIAQARCIKPNAYVPLPSRPNLVVASQVYPYLELEARERLLKALDSKPKQKMTVNSALRTVAQQYLVWRWSATKRCGVPLATPPGESNHEIGVALDIAEAGSWRPALEAQQFKWLGASDRVHFDYRGGAAASAGSSRTDVLAFQKLWNRNHPTDKIAEDGRYSPVVEQRLKTSPPEGFALGPSCAAPKPSTNGKPTPPGN